MLYAHSSHYILYLTDFPCSVGWLTGAVLCIFQEVLQQELENDATPLNTEHVTDYMRYNGGNDIVTTVRGYAFPW